eukprot:43730_1
MNPTDIELKQDDPDDADDFVQIYMVQMDIIAGHDLEKADTFGKSDPYCKISANATSYTTCTIKKTLNPKWNEHVEMTFFNDPKAIKFEIFDWDGKLGGKDDGIGECEFNLTSDIYQDSHNGFTGKIPLKNCKSGELEIKIFARKLLPLELEKRLTNIQNTVEQNTNSITNQNNEINDLNNKSNTFENEINTLESDINSLNQQIIEAKNEHKQEEQTGEGLDAEDKELHEDINKLEEEYNNLETEENDINKQLEDIKIEEDKMNTECEHLEKDITDLTQQIENKKKEAKERREREDEEKENAEKEKLKKDYDDDNNNEKENDKKKDEKVDVGAVEATSKGDD